MLLTVSEFPSEGARSSIIHAFLEAHMNVSVESAFTGGGGGGVLKVLKYIK